jgi:hypothetical protein
VPTLQLNPEQQGLCVCAPNATLYVTNLPCTAQTPTQGAPLLYPWERKRYPRHCAMASRRDERASCTLMAASLPVGGVGGPCRGYRLGAGSASCGCLIWGSATSDPVMSSTRPGSCRSLGRLLQSNQPNPNPPITCKRVFFTSFPLFGSFCPSSTCLITVLSFFPLTRGLSVVAHSTRYYVAHVIALHMACTTQG